MKKILSLLLVLVLVLGLCACGGGGSKTPKGLTVGYGRADITPKLSVGLHGYGDVGKRMSKGVLNKLYATCIALTDETGNTILLYTVDLIGLRPSLMEKFRPGVVEATGVPADNIFAAGTHTHSGPSPDAGGTYWDEEFAPAMIEAAKAAMADRAPFQVKAGKTYTEGMNFVRHYTTTSGTVIGDNFGSVKESGERTGHTTQADNEMQLIHFVREDKKDIIMVNWQAHAKTASTGDTAEGRATREMLSSDYIGSCRDYLEGKNDDLLFAFFLGAAGNLNTYSKIKSENATSPMQYDQFGQKLAGYIEEAMPNLTDRGQPQVKNAATSYPAKQPTGGTTDFEVRAAVFGEIGFVAVPYEMFDTEGMTIKKESPCDVTFVMTVANGHVGYMPSDYAFDYINCYEVRASRYVRGTTEGFVKVLLENLNTLAGK